MSKCLNFRMSNFQNVKMSKCHSFHISICQRVKMLSSQIETVGRYYYYQVKITINPRLTKLNQSKIYQYLQQNLLGWRFKSCQKVRLTYLPINLSSTRNLKLLNPNKLNFFNSWWSHRASIIKTVELLNYDLKLCVITTIVEHQYSSPTRENIEEN